WSAASLAATVVLPAPLPPPIQRTCGSRSANSTFPSLRGGAGEGAAAAVLDSLLEVAAQDVRPARVAQLTQGTGLDLPDPLPGQAEALAHLFQGARLVVDQAEAKLDHAPLPRSQRAQHVF